MSQNSAIQIKIINSLASSKRKEPSSIKGSSLLREDLALDSMDTIELIFELEDGFGIQIPDEDIQKFKTVDDVVQYVKKSIEDKPT